MAGRLAPAALPALVASGQPDWTAMYRHYATQGIVSKEDAYTREVSIDSIPKLDAAMQDTERWRRLAAAIRARRHETSVRRQARTVAVISTIPSRINSTLRPSVDSILTQSYRPDAFYVFVPHVFQREGTTYVIPEWLQQYNDTGKVTMIRCHDSGPGTIIYAVLPLEQDPSTYLIRVADDQFYGPDTLSTLLLGSDLLPGRAISLYSLQTYAHTGGVILQGFSGFLVQRKFFDETVYDFSILGNLSSWACWLNDDLWFTMHLAKKGIRREALQMREGSRVLATAYSDDALHQGGAGADNHQNFYLCNAAVQRLYPSLWSPSVAQNRVAVLVRNMPDASLAKTIRFLREQSQAPNHLYVCGAQSWIEYRVGDWMYGFVVTPLPWCDEEVPLLTAGLRVEDDSETVLVELVPLTDVLSMPDVLQSAVACARARFRQDCNFEQSKCDFHVDSQLSWAVQRGNAAEGCGNLDFLDAAKLEDLKTNMPAPMPPAWPAFTLSSTHELPSDVPWQARLGLISSRLVVVMRVRRADLRHLNVALSHLLSGSLTPDVLYLAVKTELKGFLELALDEPRLKVLELHSKQSMTEDLVAARSLEGPRAFIVQTTPRLQTANFLHFLMYAGTAWPGHVVGVQGFEYRSVGPLFFETALYPPGSVDDAHFGHVASQWPGTSSSCHSAGALWMGAVVAAHGIPSISLAPSVASKLWAAGPGQQALINSTSWDKCLDSLWPHLGRRLQRQRRIVLYLSFKFMSSQDKEMSASHLREYNVQLLLSQTMYPSAVYVYTQANAQDDIFLSPGWIGDVDGFQVHSLACGSCSDAEMAVAALEIEQYPDALLLFASVERLINDRMVSDSVRCAEEHLWSSRNRVGACGHAWPDKRGLLKETAILRRHLLS